MGFGTFTGERMSHMFGAEVDVWDRFLAREGRAVTNCIYDLKLGDGRPGAADMSAKDRALWYAVTAKRVDVVCNWHDRLWIVEVKANLCMSGLGQVLSYVELFNRGRTAGDLGLPMLVAGGRDADLEPAYRLHNVRVEYV